MLHKHGRRTFFDHFTLVAVMAYSYRAWNKMETKEMISHDVNARGEVDVDDSER
jgi:hypothetical protein